MNSRDISVKLDEHIGNLQQYISSTDKDQEKDDFSELVHKFDEFTSSAETVDYLTKHHNESEKIKNINEQIIDVIAINLTAIAENNFQKIDPTNSASLDEIINLAAQECHSIIKQILQIKDKNERNLTLERYILIAKKLTDKGDFFSAANIAVALQDFHINKLLTDSKISTEAKQILANLNKIYEQKEVTKEELTKKIVQHKGPKIAHAASIDKIIKKNINIAENVDSIKSSTSSLNTILDALQKIYGFYKNEKFTEEEYTQFLLELQKNEEIFKDFIESLNKRNIEAIKNKKKLDEDISAVNDTESKTKLEKEIKNVNQIIDQTTHLLKLMEIITEKNYKERENLTDDKKKEIIRTNLSSAKQTFESLITDNELTKENMVLKGRNQSKKIFEDSYTSFGTDIKENNTSISNAIQEKFLDPDTLIYIKVCGLKEAIITRILAKLTDYEIKKLLDLKNIENNNERIHKLKINIEKLIKLLDDNLLQNEKMLGYLKTSELQTLSKYIEETSKFHEKLSSALTSNSLSDDSINDLKSSAAQLNKLLISEFSNFINETYINPYNKEPSTLYKKIETIDGLSNKLQEYANKHKKHSAKNNATTYLINLLHSDQSMTYKLENIKTFLNTYHNLVNHQNPLHETIKKEHKLIKLVNEYMPALEKINSGEVTSQQVESKHTINKIETNNLANTNLNDLPSQKNSEHARLHYEEKSNIIYNKYNDIKKLIDKLDPTKKISTFSSLDKINNIQIKKIKSGVESEYHIDYGNGTSAIFTYNTALKTNTFTYKGTAKEKENRIVGTNGELQVKFLEDGAYDNVKTEDLMNHGLLLVKSVLHKTFIDNINDKHAYKAAITALESKFKEIILKKHSLDYVVMAKIIENNDDPPQYFLDKKNAIEKLTKELYQDLYDTYRQFSIKKTKTNQFVNAIKTAKMLVLKEEGRPTIVKFSNYKINENETQTFMSSQFPGNNEQTRPSLDRMPNKTNKAKSSNHAIEIYGKMENGKILTDAPLTGNSSPTAIFSSSKMMRRIEAVAAIKEQIARLALDARNGGSLDEPIQIDLAVMALLSSYKIITSHAVDKNINFANERFQLQDLRYAYELINDEKEFTVKIEGQELNIKVDINFMNIPANKAGSNIKYLAESDIEKRINNKGFYEYSIKLENYIEKNANLIPVELSNAIKSHFNNHDGLYGYLKNNLDQFKKDNEKYLQFLSHQLIDIGNKYPDANDEDKAKLKEKWKALKEEKRAISSQINDMYSQMIACQKPLIVNSQGEIAETIKKIQNQIAEVNKTSDPNKETLEFLLLAERYLSNKVLYYTDGYREKENNYLFQVQYLLTNEKIGKFIQSYCKSGKDRTGWIRVLRAAYKTYNRIFRNNPTVSDEDVEIFIKKIIPFAHKSSASIENTKYNSGGRGFEVSQWLTNLFSGINLGKESATIIKNVMGYTLKNNKIKKSQKTIEAPVIEPKPTELSHTPPKVEAQPKHHDGLPILTAENDSTQEDLIEVIEDDDQNVNKKEIDSLENTTMPEQFKRDAGILGIYLSSKDASDPTYKQRQTILSRIFQTIEACEIQSTAHDTDQQKSQRIPIGSIPLHGGQFTIEIPPKASGDPNEFFYQLIDGPKNIAKYSTNKINNGEYAKSKGVPIFTVPPPASGLLQQHYAMDLGLANTEHAAPADGHHGCLHMSWTPPSKYKPGSLVISIRSAEPNETNRFGEKQGENTHSASGGLTFKKQEGYEDLSNLKGIIDSEKLLDLQDTFSRTNSVKKMNSKIKNMFSVAINFAKHKNKMSVDILNHQIGKIEQYLEHFNDDVVLTKKLSEELIRELQNCNKISKGLNEYNGESEKNIVGLKEKVEKIKNQLTSNYAGKLATYNHQDNTYSSTYHKNEKDITIAFEINQQQGKTSSILTSDLTALQELTKAKGNEGSKIMTLNEAIKWIEETFANDNSLNESKKLTLENYQALDKIFLKNMLLYCDYQGYDLVLNPPNEKITYLSNSEKNDFKKFYEHYQPVLYKTNFSKSLSHNISPPTLASTKMTNDKIISNTKQPTALGKLKSLILGNKE